MGSSALFKHRRTRCVSESFNTHASVTRHPARENYVEGWVEWRWWGEWGVVIMGRAEPGAALMPGSMPLVPSDGAARGVRTAHDISQITHGALMQTLPSLSRAHSCVASVIPPYINRGLFHHHHRLLPPTTALEFHSFIKQIVCPPPPPPPPRDSRCISVGFLFEAIVKYLINAHL